MCEMRSFVLEMDMYADDECLLCLYFFFFFKQKTAYEMRISDWSSDVCSSDLDHVAAIGMEAKLAVGERARVGGEEGAAAVLDLPVTLQIGRASCRERVCQYV